MFVLKSRMSLMTVYRLERTPLLNTPYIVSLHSVFGQMWGKLDMIVKRKKRKT